MARVNQKKVKEKLEEWAKVQAKITSAEKAKNKKLAPILEAHNEKTKPILEDFDKKTAAHRAKSAALETEIKALIESDRDEQGNPKPILVSTDKAMAVVEKTEGNRVVNSQKYFDFVEVKSPEFWKSLKVTIKDAEPIVGKNKIDDLSEKKTEFVTSIKLK